MPVAARLTRRARRSAAGPPQIHILLEHAWGMGGTIRTTFNLAGHLARRGDVEIVSSRRARKRPFLTLPDGVEVTSLDDSTAPRARLSRVLAKVPSVLIHPYDYAY